MICTYIVRNSVLLGLPDLIGMPANLVQATGRKRRGGKSFGHGWSVAVKTAPTVCCPPVGAASAANQLKV
jgi:hypothetical protein